MIFGLEKTAATAIGALVLILAILGCIMGLINYGQKLERVKQKNIELKAELLEASAWKDKQLKIMTAKDAAELEWKAKATKFEVEYNYLIANPPEAEVITRWRDIASTVPDVVPLGDCDKAAVEAWKVLHEAEIVGRTSWNSTKENSFESVSGSPLPEWQRRYLRFRQDVLAQRQPLTLQMYVSPAFGSYHQGQLYNVTQIQPGLSHVYPSNPLRRTVP